MTNEKREVDTPIRLLREALDYLYYVQDEGPAGEGWKSDELQQLIKDTEAELKRRDESPEPIEQARARVVEAAKAWNAHSGTTSASTAALYEAVAELERLEAEAQPKPASQLP